MFKPERTCLSDANVDQTQFDVKKMIEFASAYWQ